MAPPPPNTACYYNCFRVKKNTEIITADICLTSSIAVTAKAVSHNWDPLVPCENMEHWLNGCFLLSFPPLSQISFFFFTLLVVHTFDTLRLFTNNTF